MTATMSEQVRYNPYDVEINRDPYPVFRRLREEAPLYYDEEYDFYALSRYADVERALKDHPTFISGRGGVLEIIKAGIEMPPGVVIFEDPPTHTMHRKLMSRMFTPKKVAGLEDKIRAYTAEALDKCVGTGSFDFVRDLGIYMPMRVIGMLMGVPDEDQDRIREQVDANLRTEEGKPMEVGASLDMSVEMFADYVEWREKHPSDDVMTDLLQAEFDDGTGEVRKLSREELLTYITVVSGAGNETTTRLIGWAGKVLGDHPDQRRELVEDPTLIPNAIEELLRYEPPAPYMGRYVAKDVELYGQTVPEGSAMVLLMGSANRDSDKFPNGDTFDIHRSTAGMMSFGYGIHFCLGASLARIEGRVALEEILKRFPEWEVDLDGARLSPTSTVRGWETLPTSIPATTIPATTNP
jgi:cytochrome P450